MDPIILNLLEEKRFEAKLVKVIVSMPAQTLATLASTRPWLISYVPDAALELLVSERDDLLPLLSDDNLLNLLSFRPTLLSAFAQLPAERLSPILRDRPALTERLPPSAEPILSSLLLRKSFLSKLSMSLMASLATSPGILKLITKYSLIQVFRIYKLNPCATSTTATLSGAHCPPHPASTPRHLFPPSFVPLCRGPLVPRAPALRHGDIVDSEARHLGHLARFCARECSHQQETSHLPSCLLFGTSMLPSRYCHL